MPYTRGLLRQGTCRAHAMQMSGRVREPEGTQVNAHAQAHTHMHRCGPEGGDHCVLRGARHDAASRRGNRGLEAEVVHPDLLACLASLPSSRPCGSVFFLFGAPSPLRRRSAGQRRPGRSSPAPGPRRGSATPSCPAAPPGAPSCADCHFRDGRGRPPNTGERALKDARCRARWGRRSALIKHCE